MRDDWEQLKEKLSCTCGRDTDTLFEDSEAFSDWQTRPWLQREVFSEKVYVLQKEHVHPELCLCVAS